MNTNIVTFPPTPGPFYPDAPVDIVALLARRARITATHAALIVDLAGLGGQPREARR